MVAARRQTEAAIASGCERCPQCKGNGLSEASICSTCGLPVSSCRPAGCPFRPQNTKFELLHGVPGR